MYKTAVITLSDRAFDGIRPDESGPAIVKALDPELFEVICTQVLPDDREALSGEHRWLSDEKGCSLILTTGGTGLSPRDITPEATLDVAERNVPGIAEAMRRESARYTGRAMLSRGVSVIRGRTLIVNLPGSPKAVRECMDFIMEPLIHGLEILSGTGTD